MKRILALLAVIASILYVGMAPAIALAASSNWDGNGFPSASCQDDTTGTVLWVWTGDDPTDLTVNGQSQSGSWVQSGGGSWKFFMTINGQNWPPVSASVTYTGDSGILTISGCNEAQPTPTPPTPTPPTPTPPTPTPPTPTPPTPTPPTPTPPTPTPTLPTPTPSVTPPPEISQFAVAPDVCRFEGDNSRIRFRILAGLILFSQIDIYIDGNLIDRNDIIFQQAASAPFGVEVAQLETLEAFIVVPPGPHAWTITEEGNPEAVLASGDVVCPTCFNLVSPTPVGNVPSTDTVANGGGSMPGLPVVLLLVALAAFLVSPFVIRRR